MADKNRTVHRIPVSASMAGRYRKGYPLLERELLGRELPQGDLFDLVDPQGHFVARGYLGNQNRGAGWVLIRDAGTFPDRDMFRLRILAAAEGRKRFFESQDLTGCFRLFNGEGDGIGGLTLDWYGGFLLISWYSEGILSFRNEVLEALKELPGVRGVYQKFRFGPVPEGFREGLVLGEPGGFPILMKENGVNLSVHLDDGPMTGFFPDQRDVRQAVRERFSRGRRVLNAFSYTGAFSVFAALGGATGTVSVDLARRSLEMTRTNFLANGIDPQGQEIVVEDIFRYLRYAGKKGLRFGLIILDPPSFARSGKKTFSVQKDFSGLMGQALELLEPEGILIASSNSARLSRSRMESMLRQAADDTGTSGSLLEVFRLPEDYRTDPAYPEGNYLKVLVWEKSREDGK